ncbi:hypothetical protein [Micromonospora sp. NPDC004704]
MDTTAARQALADAHAARLAAEAAELVAVAQARAAGVTWDEIGEATGMAGSNAHRKYAKLLTVTVEPTTA